MASIYNSMEVIMKLKRNALAISTNSGSIIIDRKLKKIIEQQQGIPLPLLACYLANMGIKFPVELSGNGSISSIYDMCCFTIQNSEKTVKFHIMNSITLCIEDENQDISRLYRRNNTELTLIEIKFSYQNGSSAIIVCEKSLFHVRIILTYKNCLHKTLCVESISFAEYEENIKKAEKILSTFFNKPFYLEKITKKLKRNFKIVK